MSESADFNIVPSCTPFVQSEKFVSLIVGPVGCLAGNTRVVTEFGEIPISSIDRPMRVLSWNAEAGTYQLAQASVAFPKGTDYLYRVVTPQGEFDAAGSHLLLCVDNEYRRVQELQAGDVLAPCLPFPQEYAQELLTSESFLNAQNLTKKAEDYQDGYGGSDRLCGLLSLSVKEGVLRLVPSRSDAQIYTLQHDQDASLQWGSLQEELFSRTRLELFAARLQTDDYYSLAVPPHPNEVNRTSEGSCEYGEGVFRVSQQFRRRKYFQKLKHVLGRLKLNLARAFHSPVSLTTNRPIISITRKEVKEIYWDIQVNGTHNYVTVDGAIHHNSSKTTAGIAKIAYHASKMYPCNDGIRRSRAIWVRNTKEQLRDTSIPDFLQWYPDGILGVYEKTNYNFTLKFDDVECEVLFRGLDEAKDVRRLLSLQASFAILDEFREIHPDIFNVLQGRLGRYPNKILNSHGCVDDDLKSNAHLWGMTNPPDADTFWEELLSNPPDNTHVTIQPSGFSPEADWLHFLPDDYYPNLAKGKSEDWIDVYVNAKFGRSLSGQPVFKSFNSGFHIAAGPLSPIINGLRPIIVGLDFGLTPAGVICQQDMRGRFLILDEIVTEGMGIVRFIDTRLKPLLAEKYPGAPVLVVGDPAGVARVQTDESTVYDILKQKGFRAIPAHTNSIVARVAAVEEMLSGQVDGIARFLVDPRCKLIIAALRGKYRYKIKSNGETDVTPEKNDASHVCFAAKTKISTPTGFVNIDSLIPGDFVTTPGGVNKVLHVKKTAEKAEVFKWVFSDGSSFIATKDHPVYVEGKGFVPLDSLQYSDILISIRRPTLCGKFIGVLHLLSTKIVNIIRDTSIKKENGCTGTYGSVNEEKFQKGFQFTTLTTTLKIIALKISDWKLVRSTLGTTLHTEKITTNFTPLATTLEKKPQNGIDPKSEEPGTVNTENRPGKIEKLFSKTVFTVINGMKFLLELRKKVFAPPHASLHTDELAEPITLKGSVLYVDPLLSAINTQKQKHAVRLVGKYKSPVADVYAIQVENEPVYFAEGVLVKNCDALQYACLHADNNGGQRMKMRERRDISRVSAIGWT